MKGIRTLVRGALPSLKERACVRACAREGEVVTRFNVLVHKPVTKIHISEDLRIPGDIDER